MQINGRLLIVDDNVSIFQSLQLNFHDFGYACQWAKNEQETMAALAETPPQAILLDLSLGKEDGLIILEKIRNTLPDCPVIMITGYGTLEAAVKAIKLGAYEFLAKPLDFHKLMNITKQAIEFSSRRAAVGEAVCPEDGEVITRSVELLSTLRKARLLANTDMPILVTGESGCGKELIANYIHTHSLRAQKPFLRINCSAFPDSLIDNELFGHEKGAFTGADSPHPGIFEQAHEGTLHLDEIGDMSLSSQAKILRTLEGGMIRRLGGTEERHVDVRIIASTNQNLPAMIKQRTFREDLFYRLKAAFIYLPPLRERTGDVEHIAKTLLERIAPDKHFSPEALAVLERHSWPGNVRELKNTVLMSAAISSGNTILSSDLPSLEGREPNPGTVPTLQTTASGTDTVRMDSLEEMEKEAIRKALEQSKFNKRKASQRLGISYKTLFNKLKSYDIE